MAKVALCYYSGHYTKRCVCVLEQGTRQLPSGEVIGNDIAVWLPANINVLRDWMGVLIMVGQYVKFAELPMNCQFSQNGNLWVKRSSRTAYLPEYKRVFYFKQNALCVVGLHSRLATDYLN